jgi:hypothetical protein
LRWALITFKFVIVQPELSIWTLVDYVLTIILGIALATTVHELGHLLVGKAFGAHPAAIYLGGPPSRVRIQLGSVRLHIGTKANGRVLWKNPPSSPIGKVLTVAAGSLVNLATVPLPLILPIPHPIAMVLAEVFGLYGLSNLAPFGNARMGMVSDGATIFLPRVRRAASFDLNALLAEPDWSARTDVIDDLLLSYRLGLSDMRENFHIIAVLLRKSGRVSEPLALHEDAPVISEPPSEQQLQAVHLLLWNVLTVPDLPRHASLLATRRIEWIIERDDTRPAAMLHTLALARFRKGAFAEVEPLCRRLLTDSLSTGERATVLATIALAQHSLGQDARTALDAAMELDASAELVDEAAEKILVRQS